MQRRVCARSRTRGPPACAFAKTDQVFQRDESACQPNPDPECHHASELKPRHHAPVHPHPHRLAHNGVRFRRRIRGKSKVQKVCNGQCRTAERGEPQHKETPTCPDDRRKLKAVYHQHQPPPTDHHKQDCRNDVLARRGCTMHSVNYTRQDSSGPRPPLVQDHISGAHE
jgi:hypothetical protein